MSDLEKKIERVKEKIDELMANEKIVCLHFNDENVTVRNAVVLEKCSLTCNELYLEYGWFILSIDSRLRDVEYIDQETSPEIEVGLYFENGKEVYFGFSRE